MSMPTTQVRIRNKEGVVLTKNGTYLTHIEMDNVGQSDFSRSYLDLQVVFKDAGLPVLGERVFMGEFGTQKSYDGQCIIRNARLTCEAFGILEENIKVNVFHQTMRTYLQSQQEKQSNQVYGNEYVTPDFVTGIANIIVPLSSFLGCGEQMYDHQRLGNSTIRLELEFQKDLYYLNSGDTGAFIQLTCDDVENTTAGNLDVTTLTSSMKFKDSTTLNNIFIVGNEYDVLWDDEDGNPDSGVFTLESVSFDTLTGYASLTFDETIFVVPAGETYTDIDIRDENAQELVVPVTAPAGSDTDVVLIAGLAVDDFYVGATYEIGYLIDTIGATNLDTWYYGESSLVSADVSGTSIALTFNGPVISIPDGSGNATISQAFLRLIQFNPIDWEVQQIDLVLHKLLKPAKLGKMAYETYSLEQTNQTVALSYRKQFYTEPNAYKFVYMTPTTGLISEINDAQSFRISLNNIDLTNRDIPLTQLTNGSLYNDRLVMNVDGLKSVQLEPQSDHQTIIYCDRCPLGQQNMVEFRIDSDLTTPMGEVVGHFFKHLQREV
jgi:hypothetical protein